MDVLLQVHSRLATAVVLYFVALGIWGVALAALGSGPTGTFRGALVIIEVVVIAQGLVGIVAWVAGIAPDPIHVLYGVALALAMPLAASMTRQQSPRRAALFLGLAAFFAAGLAIRGITTA